MRRAVEYPELPQCAMKSDQYDQVIGRKQATEKNVS